MILRTTSRFGILLFACAALTACAWPNSSANTAAQDEDPNAVIAASGTAVVKSVEPNLRKAIATHEGRDVEMYWDDQTIFVRGGKAIRVSSKYWVPDTPTRTPAGTRPTAPTPPSGQYYKESKVMADIDLPKPGEVFEFRGFKTHGQVALRIISFAQ